MPLDELELELRRLPGVRLVGFSTTDDFLMVQVHVENAATTTPTTAFETARIARRHSVLPVSVEIVRWQGSLTESTQDAAVEEDPFEVEMHSGHVVVAEESAPEESAPEESAPEESAPEESAPEETDAPAPTEQESILLDEPDFTLDDSTSPAIEIEPSTPERSRISPISAVINQITRSTHRAEPRVDPVIPPEVISTPIEQLDVPQDSVASTNALLETSDDTEHVVEPPADPAAPAATPTVTSSEPPMPTPAPPADESPAEAEHVEPPAGQPVIDLTASPEHEGRVRLLAVLPFPDQDQVEVHLIVGETRSVGRAPASHGLSGAASATLEALKGFLPEHTYSISFAHRLPEGVDTFLVVAGIADSTHGDVAAHLFGVASSESPSEAAARATLHALNRTLGIAKAHTR